MDTLEESPHFRVALLVLSFAILISLALGADELRRQSPATDARPSAAASTRRLNPSTAGLALQTQLVSPTMRPGPTATPTPPPTAFMTPTLQPAATYTPAPTAAPQSTQQSAKPGEWLVASGLAVALDRIDKTDGTGGYRARPGFIWVAAHVSLQNLSGQPIHVDRSQFEIVDSNGAEHHDWVSDPNLAWDFRVMLFYSATLSSGQRIHDRTMLLPMDKSMVGSFTFILQFDKAHTLAWVSTAP